MSIKSPLNRQFGTQFDSVFDVVKSNPMYDKTGGKIPSLDLNFAKSKSLRDSRSTKNLINFTRASSGTYVGSDGLIKTSPVNLLTYSEQFDQWTVASNSVITPNSIAAPDGTLTADLVYFSQTGATNISQSITLTQGQTYTISVYAKAVTPGTNNKFTFYIDSPTYKTPVNSFETTSEWQKFTFTFTHTDPSASTGVYVLNIGDSYITNVYFWGAQLQEGTLTDYIPTGASASGLPRFDHDPVTGESLGLLIEEERTNLLTYSEQFDQWTAGSNTTVTANDAVAPDGTLTADRVQNPNQGSTFLGNGTINNGVTYTFSAYAKAVTPGTNDKFTFNLGGNDASSQFTATSEWQRFVFTETPTNTSPGFSKAFINNEGDGFTSDIYFWGAQLEAGASFPTSYVPTSSSSVTRAPDIASIEGNNFSSWYNQSEGTVFADFQTYSTSTQQIIALTAGTSNSTRWGVWNSQLYIAQSGGQYFSSLTPSTSPKKTTFAVASNDAIGASNGSLTAQDTTVILPTPDNASIGRTANSQDLLNGHIKRLAYFPTRLPDNKLKSITT